MMMIGCEAEAISWSFKNVTTWPGIPMGDIVCKQAPCL
jgi:hypothetical protein